MTESSNRFQQIVSSSSSKQIWSSSSLPAGPEHRAMRALGWRREEKQVSKSSRGNTKPPPDITNWPFGLKKRLLFDLPAWHSVRTRRKIVVLQPEESTQRLCSPFTILLTFMPAWYVPSSFTRMMCSSVIAVRYLPNYYSSDNAVERYFTTNVEGGKS